MNRPSRPSWPVAFLVAVFFTASLVACRSELRPVATPTTPPGKPWAPLKTECKKVAGPDGKTVIQCQQQPFIDALKGMNHLRGDYIKLLERSAGDREKGLLTQEDLVLQNKELVDRLNDPWRSPWLWGVIMVMVGGGLGVAGGFVLAKTNP